MSIHPSHTVGGFVGIFLVIRAIFVAIQHRPPPPPPTPVVPDHGTELCKEASECTGTIVKGILTREIGNILEFIVKHILPYFSTWPHW
jgi:hypothetical protein